MSFPLAPHGPGRAPGLGELCWGAGGVPPTTSPCSVGLWSPIRGHVVLQPSPSCTFGAIDLFGHHTRDRFWVSVVADGALLPLSVAGGAQWSSAGPGASQGQASPPTPPNPREKPHCPPSPLVKRHPPYQGCPHSVPVPPGSASTSLDGGRAQVGMAPGVWLAMAASVWGHWCHGGCPCVTGEARPHAALPARCCRAADRLRRAPHSAIAPGPALPGGGWETRGEVMAAASPGDTCGRWQHRVALI